jgi:acyl carrier protein
VETRVKTDIHRYIVDHWLAGDERGFDDQTDLQQNGILDSFSTLAFIAFLDDTFQIQLDPADINAENFRTVGTVTKLVLEKLPK